jgi:hypothetical protein
MVDTLFADVSEFQRVVDDSYPYPILSFRSNDGTYEDRNFAANYAWAANAANTGRLTCFVVYMYWRTNWLDTVNTHKQMVANAGGPHPRMISMLDVESGGNPVEDWSDALLQTYSTLAAWLGNKQRVIGYGNAGDLNTMWPAYPTGLRRIGAGYGTNPMLPGQIAHQYTDGVYSRPLRAQRDNHTTEGLVRVLERAESSLPLGCAPFGNCDMDSADGLSAADFAAACGVGQEANVNLEQLILDQLGGPGTGQGAVDGKTAMWQGWEQLGSRTLVDGVAAIGAHLGISGFTDPKASN